MTTIAFNPARAAYANFDEALEIVKEVAENGEIALVNSVNPYRIEGQKTSAFEVIQQLGGFLNNL